MRNEEECVCSASVDGFRHILRKIRAFWTTLGSRTRRGFTCRDTLILKIPVFGQVKIPTRYMKNPFIQKRLVFGVGYPGGA